MYLAAEAALYTLCCAYGGGTTFVDGQNAARSDWTKALQQSGAGLVVQQEGDTLESDAPNAFGTYGAHGQRTQQHEIAAWVVQPIGVAEGGDAVAVQACQTLAEALADYLAGYGRLNGGTYVQRASVVRITAPQERRALVQGQPGPPTHIVQAVVVRVVTRRAWTMTEEAG